MSGTMLAGHLCATQVGERIEVDGVVRYLRCVSHRDDHDTVRLICVDPGGANTVVLDIDPATPVAVDNSSWVSETAEPTP